MNPRVLALVVVLLLAAPLLAQQFDPAPANVIIDQLTADLARLKAEVNKTTPGGVVIRVPAGADLQAALDLAQPGQTILLAPATFIGNYTLRKKASAGVITIRTDGLDDAAIPPGVRVTPALSPRMAKLGPKEAAVQTLTAEFGADGYTLIGIEFLPNLVLPDRPLVMFGWNAPTLADQPTHITFDRVYMHGSPEKGGHTGCNCHGAFITLINSWLSDFWEVGRDSQAFGAYNGAGPYLIENNYLEASGENILFGGADPAIPGLITSDIVIRRNHFFKPLAWKTKLGSVKNLFELKNAQRVLVEFNVFENIWADSQSGNAIVFTPRNQSGGCPWCVVQDVVFQYNVLKHVQTYAFNVLGLDNNQVTTTSSGRITIRHNLIEAARGVLMQDKVDGLTFDHNLLVGVTGQMFALGGGPLKNIRVTNNLMRSGLYGITGDGSTVIGLPTLVACCTPFVFTNNVIELTASGFVAYPPGNFLLPFATLLKRLSAGFVFTETVGQASTDAPIALGPDLPKLLQGLTGVAPAPLADITP
jgi:hypothetical protein